MFGLGESKATNDSEELLGRMKVLLDAAKLEVAKGVEQLQKENQQAQKNFLDALVKAKQEISGNADKVSGNPIYDQSTVMDDGGSGGTAFALRYRNDTERASLGLPIGSATDAPPYSVPIHRLEWIAKATPYDPSTVTEANPTGDEWDNALWNPVLHGDTVS